MKLPGFDKGCVVLLVDDKRRDLHSAILIQHHFRKLGVECHLEPLEAYRAVVGAYRPSMVIINHVFASHIVAWSRRLRDMGVAVGVLLNEGIVYEQDQLDYLSGAHHSMAHVDMFFCWNEAHHDAIAASAAFGGAELVVIGSPRFDFYVQPWSNCFDLKPYKRETRPLVLLCTNFVTAEFYNLPKSEAEKFFIGVGGLHIDAMKDYWGAVEAHWKGREKIGAFLKALVAADLFDIVLRPHPRESIKFYRDIVDSLELGTDQRIHIDTNSNITTLILECDVELSCETCTTAMESWLAGKPTIELGFEHYPLWDSAEHSGLQPNCDDPANLPAMVENAMTNPGQSDFAAARHDHLSSWCNLPDGMACVRMAEAVHGFILAQPQPDWSRLSLADLRRTLQLRAKRAMGKAYHYDFLLEPKFALFPGKYYIKRKALEKSIDPVTVRDVREDFISRLSA